MGPQSRSNREHSRIPFQHTVELSLLDVSPFDSGTQPFGTRPNDTAEWRDGYRAKASDLSLRGMRLSSPFLPTLGQRLRCKFEFEEFGQSCIADGNVVWSQPSGKNGGDFGLRFDRVDPFGLKSLRNYLEFQQSQAVAFTAKAPIQVGQKANFELEGVAGALEGVVNAIDDERIEIEQELAIFQSGRMGVITAGLGSVSSVLSQLRVDLKDGVPRLVFVFENKSSGTKKPVVRATEETVEDYPASASFSTSSGRTLAPSAETLTVSNLADAFGDSFERHSFEGDVSEAEARVVSAPRDAVAMSAPIVSQSFEAQSSQEKASQEKASQEKASQEKASQELGSAIDDDDSMYTDDAENEDYLEQDAQGSETETSDWKKTAKTLSQTVTPWMLGKAQQAWEQTASISNKMAKKVATGASAFVHHEGTENQLPAAKHMGTKHAAKTAATPVRRKTTGSPDTQVVAVSAKPSFVLSKNAKRAALAAAMLAVGYWWAKPSEPASPEPAPVVTAAPETVEPSSNAEAPLAGTPLAGTVVEPSGAFAGTVANERARDEVVGSPTNRYEPSAEAAPVERREVARPTLNDPALYRALPPPSLESGRMPVPSYPTLASRTARPATTDVVQTANRAGTSIAGTASSTTASPATGTGAIEFGARDVPRGRTSVLRMSSPIASLEGRHEADGFVVTIRGALSLDRASPLASAYPTLIESAAVFNRTDHSVLNIRFIPGKRPPYRVRANGTTLELTLGE